VSAFLPEGPGGFIPLPEPTSIQDRTLDEDRLRLRWELRAAQWSALDLARDVFGEEASAALSGYPARAAFRGLLHLEVPLEGIGRGDLERHREREARFTRLAALDPVLRRVSLVFVFAPALPEPAR
jgi:hypothetical protein